MVELKTDELLKKLNELSSVSYRKVLRTTAKNAGRPMLNAVRQRAPIDTGALRKTIKYVEPKLTRAKYTHILKIRPVFQRYKSGKINKQYGGWLLTGTKERRAETLNIRRTNKYRYESVPGLKYPRKIRVNTTKTYKKKLLIRNKEGKVVAMTERVAPLKSHDFIQQGFDQTKDIVESRILKEWEKSINKIWSKNR